MLHEVVAFWLLPDFYQDTRCWISVLLNLLYYPANDPKYCRGHFKNHSTSLIFQNFGPRLKF